ncbi:hypothetical protein ATANTOWER_011363, partial [Ataeniobius toweri]|nr:hypothetical protein [Ataeniobius toweri]
KQGTQAHCSTFRQMMKLPRVHNTKLQQMLEYQGPVYALDEDVEYLHPGLHSTPDASNQGTTEYFYIVDNSENPDAIQDTQTIMSNFNNIDDLDDTEDSGAVQIGPRSDHYDGDCASSLPLMRQMMEAFQKFQKKVYCKTWSLHQQKTWHYLSLQMEVWNIPKGRGVNISGVP